MKIIIKGFLILLSTIVLLVGSLLLIDMSDYDSSYVNRSSLVIDVKNLNSRHSHNIIFNLRKTYISFLTKFSKKYEKRWSVESEEERLKKPEFKTIYKKTTNFSKSNIKNNNYKNHKNWTRSNGNNTSSRFSSLKLINKDNVKNLKLAWSFKTNDSLGKEIQANPIAENGFIYTPTPGNNIICINGQTGKEVWRFNVENGVAGRRGLTLWKNKTEDFSRLYFTNNKNKLFALNSKNGKRIKTFGTNGEIKIGLSPIAPLIFDNYLVIATFKPDIQVYDTITGKLLWKYYLKESKNSLLFENFKRGSPWGGISSDDERGLVFLTTGNPAPDYIGVDRPGDNLYANSVIAIDIRNKKKLWHFQEISHDIWNMDLAAPPILTKIKKNNYEIDVVVAVTKLGNTIVLDRVTGEPIYDIVKKRAPTSKIPGEITSPYQPSINLPEPICRNEFKKKYITNVSKENNEYMSKIANDANFGFPKPYEIGKKSIQIASCVRWAGASIDPDKNIMFVTADALPDLIEIKKHPKSKYNYYAIGKPFNDLDGYPGIMPPWGTLTSLNLNNGKIIWQIPFGEYQELTLKGLPITGTPNRSGATATSGGLVFASGTWDNKIRAFDSENGKELWSYTLSSLGSASPTSFMIQDKQYIVIPAFEKNGDEVFAFSLN